MFGIGEIGKREVERSQREVSHFSCLVWKEMKEREREKRRERVV